MKKPDRDDENDIFEFFANTYADEIQETLTDTHEEENGKSELHQGQRIRALKNCIPKD